MKKEKAVIYCQDLGRKILISQCYDAQSSECKTCKEKPSQSNADKHRKRYTYKQRKNLKDKLNTFYDGFRNANEKSLADGIFFMLDTFESNAILNVLIYAKPKKLRDMLLHLADEGADISVIYDNLRLPGIPEYLKNDHPLAWQLYGGELSPEWNQKVEEYKLKKKELNNKKKIKGAIGQIKNLEPVPETKRFRNETPFINTKLMEAQNALKELERVIDKYFEAQAIEGGLIGYSAKWGLPISEMLDKDFKKVTPQSHNILNRRFARVKDELMKLENYTANEAHKTIAKLFKLAMPHLCNNLTYKQVEDRCK